MLRVATSALASVLLVGCSGAETAETLGAVTSAIVAGDVERGPSPVVALAHDGRVFCSGVLVAPRVVLTAAHCLDEPIDRVRIEGEADDGVLVRTTLAHPGWDPETFAHDLGALVLEAPVAAAPSLRSEGWSPTPGEAVSLVGFGRASPTASSGERRSGTARIREVTPDAIELGPGPSLACVGDSGGAVLAGGRLVAITSHGDPGCRASSVAVRLDAERGFVDEALAAGAPEDASSCAVGRSRAGRAGLPALVVVVVAALARRRARRT